MLFRHHGLDNLANERAHTGPEGEPALGAADLLDLVHRFPNVVLWLNGHTHTNGSGCAVTRGGHGGFWEVTTCAVVDWPCQTRVVELSSAPTARSRSGARCSTTTRRWLGRTAQPC